MTGTPAAAGKTGSRDYATVAYNSGTGRELWVRRYNGPGNGDDWATTVAVNLFRTAVFVTGWSAGRTTGGYYATVAYRVGTGRQLWVRRYNALGDAYDSTGSMTVSRDGTHGCS